MQPQYIVNAKRRRGRPATVYIRCTPGFFHLLTRDDPHAIRMLNAHLNANHGMLLMIQGRSPGSLAFHQDHPALTRKRRHAPASTLASHQIGRIVGRLVLDRYAHMRPPESADALRRWMLTRIRHMIMHWPSDQPFPLDIPHVRNDSDAYHIATLHNSITCAIMDATDIACRYIADRRHFLAHSRRRMTSSV